MGLEVKPVDYCPECGQWHPSGRCEPNQGRNPLQSFCQSAHDTVKELNGLDFHEGDLRKLEIVQQAIRAEVNRALPVFPEGDFEMMLRRLCRVIRKGDAAQIKQMGEQAADLLRRKGAASVLR